MDQPAPISLVRKAAWRHSRDLPSLPEVNRSIAVRPGSTWRRAAAFLGPGYLVAVGYMDPGNWTTSIAGGSKYGYALLSVALISNIMAIVLQSLCARLGAMAPRGACHLRHSPRGGDRHGHRPQPPLRHPARDRRDHHGARRVPDPVSSESRLPLGRGLHHHPARRDRGLLRHPDRH